MAQVQVDCGMFQETKLTCTVYKQESRGFRVTATAAPSAHCSNFAIFYHEAKHFAIKEIRLHGLNLISLQMVTGRRL